MAQIADDRNISAHILVQLRRINIEMDDPCLRRKRRRISRHAITEARTDREEQVAFLDRHIGCVGAVHSCHSREAVRSRGNRAEPHQCRHRRHPCQSDNLADVFGRIREHGTAADKEHRPMRGKDRLRRLPYRRYLIGDLAGISVQFDRLRTAILDFRIEYVLCHIDDDDARTPRPRDIECLFYHTRQLVHVLDEVVMLCDRRRNADDVRLLERILSDVRIRDLSRDADHRNGVHMRRRNPRHEIRCPGP